VTDLARRALPQELEALAFLLGTWTGEGTASYPTMDEDVPYGERIVFEHVGEPFVLYAQESWVAADESPLHFERGGIRLGPDSALELVVAHPVQGVVEIAQGRLDGTSFDLSTADGSLARTHTGDPVDAVLRRYRVWRNVMTYEVDLGTDEVDVTAHLVGELRRQ
jgi:nitrobindin-like protein